MYKKSQVTLFIILGIVILVIFGFVFVVTQRATETKLEVQVEKTISDFLKSKTINYYVITCLDKVSKEALILTGEQAGFIYQDQDSVIDWNIPYIEYQYKKVAYQIYSSLSRKLKKKNKLVYDPPYYPCLKKGPDLWKGLTCHKNYNHNQEQYFFGSTGEPINNINPDLCKEKITIPGYVCSCYNPPNSLNCKNSIQAQLEQYIEKKVKECTDFSNIKGYQITAEDIKADVSFSDNSVLFKIDFPIIIRVQDSEPIIEVLQFSVPQQIRFKILYNLARELIKRDIDDITFDIVKDGQELANIYGDIKITKDSSTYKHSSIITLEDSQSRIDGKKFVFMFARENREPALDYMNFISFSNYDLYVIENQSLNFTPTAYDPDEFDLISPLIYEYSGWREDALKASRIYSNPDKGECVHLFSELTEERRCAEYKLTKSDVGEHKLTVKAQDLGSLQDYQEIKILVDDIPEIIMILNNTYIDVDNNRASIEDPFIFDASKTKDEFPKPVKLLFNWQHIKPDGKEGFSKQQEYNGWTYTNKVNLPKQWFDIKDMSGFFDVVGKHKIKLEVKNQQATPLDNIAINRSEIIVTQCLPHRNNHAPYPFNGISWDLYGNPGETTTDFQGDHTCCKDDGTYENINKVCYELEDYGCFTDFINSYSEYYDPGNLRQQGTNPTIQYGKPIDNKQVYKRTLIRKCSGTRGNVCDGPIQEYKIEWSHNCSMFTNPPRYCKHAIRYGEACKP